MSDPSPKPDAASVAAQWDAAATDYAAGQARGLDYYRYEFFGPALVDLCDDVRNARLLDVGCGAGYFAREMSRAGARVIGIDISTRMIDEARAIDATDPLGIEYRVCDAAQLDSTFAAHSFDVATSCLALQDMPNPADVFRAVHHVLAPNGRFVLSITHPFSDTPFRDWERNADRSKRWLCVDRYFDEVPVTFAWERWPGRFVTTSYHATLETWIGWVLDAGFEIRQLKEPHPSATAVAQRANLEDATRVPYYLSLDLRKRL